MSDGCFTHILSLREKSWAEQILSLDAKLFQLVEGTDTSEVKQHSLIGVDEGQDFLFPRSCGFQFTFF